MICYLPSHSNFIGTVDIMTALLVQIDNKIKAKKCLKAFKRPQDPKSYSLKKI